MQQSDSLADGHTQGPMRAIASDVIPAAQQAQAGGVCERAPPPNAIPRRLSAARPRC